ncbi:MAG TPA: hypothetical protein VKG43_00385 [Acidimicrobiales bacterium]|nr:hypothetical protein [Acidimicrobiales bacterium]
MTAPADGPGRAVEVPEGPAGAPPIGRDEAAGEHGAVLWVCLAVGWAVIIFGIHGLVSQKVNPPAVFRILIGLNILNDAVVVPAALVVAVVVRRLVPRWALVPVDVGLIASAAVLVYAFPLVGSWGKSARAGHSRLPFDYTHSLLMVLGAIWVVCALMALWSWRRTRSNPA